MAKKEISAAEAIKFFGKNITVQTATPVTIRGKDGKERPGYKTADAPLAEQHVLAARDYGASVTIVTIDGRRHEALKKAA
jgi:hypothetical protein